jgi:hypothetical protein
MNEKIQATEQEAATTNVRWQVVVVVGCFSMLRDLFLRWLPKPWAMSLAWLMVFGIFIIFLYRTKPKFRRHPRMLLLMLTLWLGGAITSYFNSFLPNHPSSPLWVSGVFWGLATSLIVWVYVKRKQNRHVS